MNTNWNTLDKAALIFPSSVDKADTNVFRFTCELNGDHGVEPDILQTALNETMESFDLFRCVLKRGLFWYYFENSNLKAEVKEEYRKLCDTLYDKRMKNLLYEITYYGNRINLEMFHGLSDGTGAMHFLSMLVANYLSLKHDINARIIDYDASHNQMQEDSFYKYYTGNPKKKYPKQSLACELKGTKYAENQIRVITGKMSVKAILTETRKHKTTLTAFLCACLLNSIADDITLNQRKKPVTVSIPVNLRNYFPSQSARNFFSIVLIGYDYFRDTNNFDDVLGKVTLDLRNKLTREYLTDSINNTISAAYNPFAKIAPLVLKDIVLKSAYRHSQKLRTATLSNVGIIKLPAELEKYVASFSVCASTNTLQACICSYGDNLTVSFTTPFISSDIERRFFRMIVDYGIDVEITSNTEGLEKDDKILR